MKIILITIGITFLISAGFAQTRSGSEKTHPPEMHVDMPDETEETDLVDPGQLQVETGLLLNGYSQSRSSIIAQVLMRYGVSKHFEFRAVAEDGRERDKYLDETVQNTSPLSVGMKISLVKDYKIFPDVTAIIYTKLPFTSHTAQQQAYWSPAFLFAFQNQFSEKWKLEYNVGIQQEAFSTRWFWVGNASLHYKLLEPLEIFAEYYGQWARGESSAHNIGGGAAYECGKHLEFYVAGGHTVENPDWNYFVSGGVAWRTMK